MRRLFLLIFCVIGLFRAEIVYGDDFLYMAKEALRDKIYDVAENFAKKAIDQTHSIDAVFTLAQVYIEEGKGVKAIEILSDVDKAGLANEEKGGFYGLMGSAYMLLEEYEKAGDFFKRSVPLLDSQEKASDAVKKMYLAYKKAGLISIAKKALLAFQSSQNIPQMAKEQASFLLAEIAYKTGDLAKARQLLDSFITNYPDSAFLPMTYFYLADICVKEGKDEDAMALYDKMEKAYSNNKQVLGYALQGKIWLALKKNDMEKAKALLDKLGKEASVSEDSLLFLKATIAFKNKDYKEAQKGFSEIVDNYKDSQWFLSAMYWLAESLANQGENDKAIELYLDVISRANAENQQLVNDAYYGLAWAYLHKGDYKEAMSAFQQLADISDDETVKVSALCHVADTLQEKGNYKEAIEQYQKIEELYPDGYFSDYIAYQIGNCLLKLEDYDGAILAYKEFLEEFNDSSFRQDVIYNLAIAYFNKGNYSSTIDVLKLLPEDKQTQSHIVYITALSYYNMGRYKNALHLFRALLQKEPNLPNRVDVEYELAWSYYRLGREKEAYKRFRDIVEKYPKEAISQEVLLWLIEDAISSKKFEVARQYLQKFEERYPDSVLYWTAMYDRAWLEYLDGKVEKSLKLFSELIERLEGLSDKGEELADARLARAYIYKEQGRKEEALEDLKKVVESGKGNLKKAYIDMADVYEAMGRISDSIYSLSQALKYLPKDGNCALQFRIGALWQSAGEIDKAIDAYMKVIYSYKDDEELVAKACVRAGRLYEKKGDVKNAKQLYNKASLLKGPDAKVALERLKLLEK